MEMMATETTPTTYTHLVQGNVARAPKNSPSATATAIIWQISIQNARYITHVLACSSNAWGIALIPERLIIKKKKKEKGRKCCWR